MSCTIRHVEPRDAVAIHPILTSESVVDGSMRLPYAPFSSTEKRLAGGDGTHTLVAEHDGEAVGFAELVTCPQHPRHAHAGELNMIVVRQDLQKQGIGRALASAILSLADQWLMLERVGLTVWDRNEHAVRLYQSLGFEIEGTLRSYVRWRGTLIDAYAMGRLRPTI